MCAWGYNLQGSDQLLEIDELGSMLSTMLHCPVHYPAFGKNLFECRCGVIIPVYLARTHDWKLIMHKHEEEAPMARMRKELE